ncbi:MAG: N-acetyl-gamma-glutamyl-phosphate reductase, partial [Acidobacteria bacterium]|nr:N-acetyl-gamma-glutamyl-phosphate reductase [Acidobacteriota bacterium]
MPTPQEVVRVAVAGATGYAGGELISILLRHPCARINRLMADIPKAIPIEGAHPALRGRSLPLCELPALQELRSSDVDVVFLATPHQASHDLVPGLLERGLRVIDLSAAFRLKDPAAYPRWYGFEHKAAAALAEAVYGAPELNADGIRKARLVANPGCYATSVNLALVPLLKAGWADLTRGIVADAKSGATGAGRTPSDRMHFPEIHENLCAYGLFHHRHVPEMLQTLGLAETDFIFTPHLLPTNRGILSTIYVRLAARRRLSEVVALFQEFYARAPLVRVYGAGSLPEVQGVARTQYFDVGFALDEANGRLIVISALDNLGKGAAGQAAQNMN